MRKFYISLSFFLFFINSFSQNEANNWYFGQGAGITFNSGTATAMTSGQLYTLEGCSSISDPNGNLLFYTDGRRVWNRNHLPMQNSTAPLLKGDPSSSQSGMIVPKPGSSTNYYIFTVDMQGGLALIAGDADGVSNGLMYSEVDMSAAGGLGAIVLTNKNVSLLKPTTEGLSAVKDASGNGYWVVTHGCNNNNYYSYHVTAAGVDTIPVISSTGPIVSVTGGFPNFGAGAAGYTKISPNGKKIAACHYRENKQVVISDFNTTTGVVSNSLIASINQDTLSEGPYGVEFSNCNEYLYVTEDFASYGTASNPYPKESIIWRFDLNASDIVASKSLFQQVPNELIGALQLAPDGKIYCAKWVRLGTSLINYTYGYGNSLHAINNPRLASATFTANAISLGGRTSTSGLPPFITTFFYNSSIRANNMVTNDTILFCLGDSIQFRGTTSAYDSVRWYFNDPSTGIYNTSTILNPTHLFSDSGTYQVSLLKYLCEFADTTRKNLLIRPRPVITDISNVTVCSGTSVVLDATANPVTSYLWNTGAVTPTITVDTAGKYVVTANNNGCISQDSMYLVTTITVSVGVTISSNTSNTICQGDNVTLSAIPVAGLPSSPLPSYQWYLNGNLLGNDTTNTFLSDSIKDGDVVDVVFTQNATGFCITGGTTATNSFPFTVRQRPVINNIPDQILCFGENTTAVSFNSNLPSTSYNWTNNNTTIGLGSSGTGNIGSFTASNGGTASQTGIITVTPINNGCSGIPETFSYTVNECALPVELVSFSGRKVEDFQNNLYWITATELNSDYFALEHCQDAIHFKEIYREQGAGNSNQPRNYDYMHYNVPEGTNFYRLKIVDLDGSYTYSDIVKINNLSEKYQVNIFPNPATNHLFLNLQNANGRSNIIIYNDLGQVMHRQTSEELSNQLIQLDISDFADGVYFINISDSKHNTTFSWIKQ